MIYAQDSSNSPRKVAQTQTSPESTATAMKGHFSIGSSGKEERHSPKLSRREHSKTSKTRTKRAMSPANSQQTPSPNRTLNLSKDKVSL